MAYLSVNSDKTNIWVEPDRTTWEVRKIYQIDKLIKWVNIEGNNKTSMYSISYSISGQILFVYLNFTLGQERKEFIREILKDVIIILDNNLKNRTYNKIIFKTFEKKLANIVYNHISQKKLLNIEKPIPFFVKEGVTFNRYFLFQVL